MPGIGERRYNKEYVSQKSKRQKCKQGLFASGLVHSCRTMESFRLSRRYDLFSIVIEYRDIYPSIWHPAITSLFVPVHRSFEESFPHPLNLSGPRGLSPINSVSEPIILGFIRLGMLGRESDPGRLFFPNDEPVSTLANLTL